jgi:hypothetical protein
MFEYTATIRKTEVQSIKDLNTKMKVKGIPEDAEMRVYPDNYWFRWNGAKPQDWFWRAVPYPTSGPWFHIWCQYNSQPRIVFTALGQRNAEEFVKVLNGGALGTVETILKSAQLHQANF